MRFQASVKRLGQRLRSVHAQYAVLASAGVALAVLVRIRQLPFESFDFIYYSRVWYQQIAGLGLAAFSQDFGDYNPPHLYLLYLVARALPGLSQVIAVKLVSIVADFLCAALVFLIVRLRRQSGNAALLSSLCFLLAPTVVLNGSWWGQSDSIYAFGVLASLYGALTGRPWLVTIAFGAALAFKLQAIFFLPFLLALLIQKQLSWRHGFAVPVVLLAAVIPAWAAGGSMSSLLTVYLRQAEEYTELTLRAPTLYALLPSDPDLSHLLFPAGVLLACAGVTVYLILVARSKTPFSRDSLVQLALLTVLLLPYLSPRMHERYFFLADVLSIVYAAYVPSGLFVALLVNLCSALSYPTVARDLVPQSWLALAMLLALAVVIRRSVTELYPAGAPRHEAAIAAPSPAPQTPPDLG